MDGLMDIYEVRALLEPPESVFRVARPSGRDMALPYRRAERTAFMAYSAYLLDLRPTKPDVSPRQCRYVHLGFRDGFGCYLCGVFLPPWDWTIDHVLPRSRGGMTEQTNLRQACAPCNHDKGSMTLREWRRFVLTQAVEVAG